MLNTKENIIMLNLQIKEKYIGKLTAALAAVESKNEALALRSYITAFKASTLDSNDFPLLFRISTVSLAVLFV